MALTLPNGKPVPPGMQFWLGCLCACLLESAALGLFLAAGGRSSAVVVIFAVVCSATFLVGIGGAFWTARRHTRRERDR